jgi:tetratricopeptide (TPR) repeat protein
MQLKQQSEAVENLRHAVALKPSDKATIARANVWIGQILMAMPADSLPAALQAFRDAAAIDSANGDAIRGAGLSLLLMDNCQEALQWLNRGAQVEPDHVQGHVWLAQGYIKCKNIPQGKIEFNKVLELDPTNKIATDGLNQIRKYETAQQNKGKAKPSGTKP